MQYKKKSILTCLVLQSRHAIVLTQCRLLDYRVYCELGSPKAWSNRIHRVRGRRWNWQRPVSAFLWNVTHLVTFKKGQMKIVALWLVLLLFEQLDDHFVCTFYFVFCRILFQNIMNMSCFMFFFSFSIYYISAQLEERLKACGELSGYREVSSKHRGRASRVC